jgi:beta-mannosidase
MTCIRRTDWQERTALVEGWELLRTAPGAAETPSAVEALAEAWMPAEVPGTLASALRARGVDPTAAGDLDGSDVWYRLRFRGPPGAENVALCLGGLATVAEVWLNGMRLLRSESMWQRHRLEVGPLIRAENVLHLRFLALAPLLGAKRPRPRWKTRLVTQQQLRWWRTTFLGRIPGWTPSAPPVGPFRSVVLEHGRGPEVLGATLRTEVSGTTGTLDVSLRVRAPDGRPSSAELRIAGEKATLAARTLSPGIVELGGRIDLPGVERWWPHTHGRPALFTPEIRLPGVGQVELAPVGFRSLEADTAGGGFGLVVNGTRVFCRGASWTPLDVLSPGGSAGALGAALEQARDAGMNMLRVAGPFAYEDDAFHDACDALGILVFQDFMFANLDYPADDPAFLAAATAEADEVVARLGWRPSTAVFCGNSEVEQQAAMLGLERELWRNPLFAEVLPARVRAGSDVPYVPSSPSGGALPFQPGEGVAHYYGVGAYRRPLEDARRAEVKFASECLAFAHVPDRRTVQELLGDVRSLPTNPLWKARVPRDNGAEWDFEEVRDAYLRMLFGVEPSALRSSDPERYLALGRAVSAEVVTATIAEWRRHGSPCNGALVWFLRDLWAGAGWGMVDSIGRPKSAYWALRRAFAPRALFLTDEGTNGIAAHLVNDGPEPVDGRLQITLFREGHLPLHSAERTVRVEARGSLRVWVEEVLGTFVDVGYAFRFGPPAHDLVVARWLGEGDRPLSAAAFHCPLGRPSSIDPELRLRAEVVHLDGRPALELTANRFAQTVSLALEGIDARDDFFHLAPGVPHWVELVPGSQRGAPRGTAWPLNAAAPTRFGGQG